MQPSALRTVLAGISGGFAMNLAMMLTFRLIGFGWRGKGILLNPDVQSGKLIAVWTEMEPLPLVVNNPVPIIAGIIPLLDSSEREICQKVLRAGQLCISPKCQEKPQWTKRISAIT